MNGSYSADYFLEHEEGIGPRNLTDFTLCIRFNPNYLRPYGLLSYTTFLDDNSLAMGFDIRSESLYLCVWKYLKRKQGKKCKKMENFRVHNEWHHFCWSYKTVDLDSDTKEITTKLYYNGKKVERSKLYSLYLFLSLNSFLINILIWKYNYNNTCFFQVCRISCVFAEQLL